MRQLWVFAALWAVGGHAWAQATPAPEPASPITDQFALRASFFFGTAQTDGRVDPRAPALGPPVLGTPFSLENDFRLSPRDRELRAEFMFRLRERGRLRVNLWELTRRGVTNPPTIVVYGGNTFRPTDRVTSEFDWRQIDLTWTYSFLRAKRFELGAGLGLHLIETEAIADAILPAPAKPAHEDFSGAGPFVTAALDGTWRISRRFSLSARGQYLHLTVSSVKGSLADYHGDLQFRWRPNMAFGLGFESTQTRVDVKNNNPNGFMRLAIHGPELFVRASF